MIENDHQRGEVISSNFQSIFLQNCINVNHRMKAHSFFRKITRYYKSKLESLFYGRLD